MIRMRNLLKVLPFLIFQIIAYGQNFEDYLNRAASMQRLKNDSSFIMIEMAIKVASNKDEILKAKMRQTEFYNSYGRPKEGIAYLNALIADTSLTISDRFMAKIYNTYTIYYSKIGDLVSQLTSAHQALFYANSSGDDEMIFYANFSMFDANYQNGNLEQSLKHALQAFDTALNKNNRFMLFQIAYYFFSYNRHQLEKEPFSKYLLEFLNRTNPRSLPGDPGHTGFEYLKGYELSGDQWLALYQKSKENKYDRYISFRIAQQLCKVLAVEKRHDKIIEVLEHEIANAKEQGALFYLQDYYNQISLAYNNLNLFKKSNQNLEKYYALRDSIHGLEVKKNLDSLNIKFETVKKDQEIAQQQIEIYKSNRQRNLLLGSIFFLGLAGILIFMILRRKHIYQKELADREQKIQIQQIEKLKQNQKIIALDNVLLGEENERKRIAKDLHDSLGSLLTSVKLQVQKVSDDLGAVDGDKSLDKISSTIAYAANEVRRISHDMMPEALINLGLISTIQDLADEINNSEKMQVNMHVFGLDESAFDDQQKIGIYRIIQELTQNVIKHADAQNMIIQLTKDADKINIEVEDDGIGFDLTQIQKIEGIGLKNITSRVSHLDGTIRIDSKPGGPTIFIIQLPRIS